MSTTYGAARIGTDRRIDAAASTVFFERYWDAFQERRKRQRLRPTLCDLSDRELMDIGTTRGEIDYVASNRGIDPRGIRSAEWVRYLPTVDGQNCTLPDAPMPRNRVPIRVQKRNTRYEQMTFAVGTRVTSRPPHRSVRAQFGHTAPTSGL